MRGKHARRREAREGRTLAELQEQFNKQMSQFPPGVLALAQAMVAVVDAVRAAALALRAAYVAIHEAIRCFVRAAHLALNPDIARAHEATEILRAMPEESL